MRCVTTSMSSGNTVGSSERASTVLLALVVPAPARTRLMTRANSVGRTPPAVVIGAALLGAAAAAALRAAMAACSVRICSSLARS